MGNWEEVASGADIDINKYLDFRQYDTIAELEAESADWGSSQIFRIARVIQTGYYYYWNGATWSRFPATGGAGAPTDASYVTISAEAGLSAETLHANIAEAYKHTPKAHTHTESEISDLDHDAQKIKGKTVDDAAIGDDKILVYKTAGTKLVYEDKPSGGGDMYKSTYDTNSDNIVDKAMALDEGGYARTINEVRYHTPSDHKNRHKTGGVDAFTSSDLLDAVARVKVEQSGVSKSAGRRTLNLIPGTGISMNITDDAANEEVDIIIGTTGGASYKLANDWIIYKVGTTYWRMDDDGDAYSNSNAATLINDAFTALGTADYFRKVLIRGDI